MEAAPGDPTARLSLALPRPSEARACWYDARSRVRREPALSHTGPIKKLEPRGIVIRDGPLGARGSSAGDLNARGSARIAGGTERVRVPWSSAAPPIANLARVASIAAYVRSSKALHPPTLHRVDARVARVEALVDPAAAALPATRNAAAQGCPRRFNAATRDLERVVRPRSARSGAATPAHGSRPRARRGFPLRASGRRVAARTVERARTMRARRRQPPAAFSRQRAQSADLARRRLVAFVSPRRFTVAERCRGRRRARAGGRLATGPTRGCRRRVGPAVSTRRRRGPCAMSVAEAVFRTLGIPTRAPPRLARRVRVRASSLAWTSRWCTRGGARRWRRWRRARGHPAGSRRLGGPVQAWASGRCGDGGGGASIGDVAAG